MTCVLFFHFLHHFWRVTAGVRLHKWTHTKSQSAIATCFMQIEVLAGEMPPPWGLKFMEQVQAFTRFKWRQSWHMFCLFVILSQGRATFFFDRAMTWKIYANGHKTGHLSQQIGTFQYYFVRNVTKNVYTYTHTDICTSDCAHTCLLSTSSFCVSRSLLCWLCWSCGCCWRVSLRAEDLFGVQ